MSKEWRDTPMGELLPLEECAEILDRFRKPINSEERAQRQGNVPYFGANGQTGWIDEPLFNEELVLLGEDAIDFLDPLARKAYRIDGPSWVNNHAHVLRPHPDKVLATFLTESLNLVDYSQFVSFGTRSKLTQKSMKRITISVPPMATQQRIVDLIESVGSYIDALRAQAAATRTARTSLLHKLLNAGGEDWAHSTLGEACEMYQPKTITKKDLSDDGNFPVYGANGLIGRYDQYNHEESEIAVTCRGATCGTVNRIPERSWITGNAMVIRPLREDLSKEYLFLALSGATNLKATISGSAQPQITRASLKPVALPIPPPHEQNRIVDLVASVEELTATSETTLVSAIQLRAALLEELLSGNHEIPESYDALLEAS